MENIMTWEELLDSGELEGYDGDYINYMDADVATRTPCENCGGECAAYGRTNSSGSYRAFSVCQNCRRVIEF